MAGMAQREGEQIIERLKQTLKSNFQSGKIQDVFRMASNGIKKRKKLNWLMNKYKLLKGFIKNLYRENMNP